MFLLADVSVRINGEKLDGSAFDCLTEDSSLKTISVCEFLSLTKTVMNEINTCKLN